MKKATKQRIKKFVIGLGCWMGAGIILIGLKSGFLSGIDPGIRVVFVVIDSCGLFSGAWFLIESLFGNHSPESETKDTQKPEIIKPKSPSDIWETLEIPRTDEKKNSLTDPWKQKVMEA